MWLMRVLTFSVSSACTTSPGRLSSSIRFSSSYTMVRLGLKSVRNRLSSRGLSKNSSLMYNCSTSPSWSRWSRWARAPLHLMRFRRMYFCSSAGGSSGRDLDTKRSSRCPASFFPMVSSRMGAPPTIKSSLPLYPTAEQMSKGIPRWKKPRKIW